MLMPLSLGNERLNNGCHPPLLWSCSSWPFTPGIQFVSQTLAQIHWNYFILDDLNLPSYQASRLPHKMVLLVGAACGKPEAPMVQVNLNYIIMQCWKAQMAFAITRRIVWPNEQKKQNRNNVGLRTTPSAKMLRLIVEFPPFLGVTYSLFFLDCWFHYSAALFWS